MENVEVLAKGVGEVLDNSHFKVQLVPRSQWSISFIYFLPFFNQSSNIRDCIMHTAIYGVDLFGIAISHAK